MVQGIHRSGFVEPCSSHRPLSHMPPLRLIASDQLERALHARISPITIWDRIVAARYERLVWLQERQWQFFTKLVDTDGRYLARLWSSGVTGSSVGTPAARSSSLSHLALRRKRPG